MRSGGSELFALGTVSGRPGLYLARRVDRDGQPVGVVVVKVEFDDVEAAWARTPGASFVIDPHGVILVTSISGWRFDATRALDPATLSDARRSLQFGNAPPARAPVDLSRPLATATIGGTEARYRVAYEAAPLATGAQLVHLAPLEPALAAARTQALLFGAGLLIVAGIATGFLLRIAEKRRLQQAAHAALEAEVERRTAELRDANARLRVESEERAQADRRFRAAREELAQASRLGSIGQITAGVAHEINQPVAAIRTFAESAGTLIERDAPDKARENLGHIIALTERIGTITAELRGFARKRAPASGTTELGSAIDGTMLLLGERARGAVTLAVSEPLRTAVVRGDRIRLEQILVNLLQNALEATADRPARRITLAAEKARGTIRVTVADSGAGIDPEVRAQLFTPFTSGKAEGLGLGLAIARDIAREFGGDLTLVEAAAETTFLLVLRPA